jgi:hypothetical protein
VTVSGNDFGPVTNTATGHVLTDPAASTVDGTRLVMENGNGDLSAPWRVSYHHYADG